MATLEEYADRYQNIRFERRNGILQMTFHTNGGPLQWGGGPHEEFPRAFADVGSDRENRVIILTGTGDAFSGPQGTAAGTPKRAPRDWDKTYWEGKKLLGNLLDIEVPMIAAVNGPALRHSEIPLLCDIVIAADTAAFQDSGHFMSNLVPGDGVHVVYPMLLGANRGRYFLLTGQSIGGSGSLAARLGQRSLGSGCATAPSVGAGGAGCREVRPSASLHPSCHHAVHKTIDAGSSWLRLGIGGPRFGRHSPEPAVGCWRSGPAASALPETGSGYDIGRGLGRQPLGADGHGISPDT